MISGILIALLMLAASPAPAADGPLAEWLALLAEQSPLELQFVETRESGLLSEGLTVTGRLGREQGRLIRYSESPRIETHILAESFVEIRNEQGHRQRFSIRRAPELAALREALLAILDGDIERLEAHFEADLRQADQQHWELSLTPRQDQVTERVSSLELTGQAGQIDQLKMTLTDGEHILTRFESVP